MTSNRERDDRRVIAAAVTISGLVSVDQICWYTQRWYDKRPRSRGRFLTYDAALEAYLAQRVAGLRAEAAQALRAARPA